MGAAAAAWLWWLPGAVASRAQEAIARRTGSEVSIGGVGAGLGTVVLEDVRVGSAEGGVTVRAAAVRLSGRPLAWLMSGTAGIERVEATGVDVDLDLARPELASTVARWRRGAHGSSDAAGGPRRDVRIEHVSVHAHDAHGALVEVREGFARRLSGRLSGGAGALVVGEAPGDVVDLRELEADLASTAQGPLIQRVGVGGGRMVWAARDELEGDHARPSVSTGVRLGAAWAALRGADAVAPVVGAPTNSAVGSATDRATPTAGGLALLAPAVSFVAADLEIATRGPAGEKTILRGLRATVDGLSGGAFRATGAGTGEPSGAVRWDVVLQPTELRAEGSLGLTGVPLALLLPLLPDAPLFRPEDARIDAEVVVRGEGLERLLLDGRVRVTDMAVASPRISPEPVRGISFAVDGRGEFIPAQRRLTITSARLSLGPDPDRAAVVNLTGTLERAPDHYLVDLAATLPVTACGVAVGAIPHDLLAELSGFSFAGTLSGRLRVLVDSRDLEATRVEVGVQDGCAFETVPGLADLRRFEGPFIHRVVEPDGTTFEMETGPGTANWTPISEISPFLIHAVLAHEDGAFFRHRGFAPSEIQVALVRNLRAGRYVQGASTITMQLVKNLFLRREKTLARKVQEVLLTWWIERMLDKAHILELYLNVIEYGPSIYGIRQASEHYFGRTPAELSPGESAFLATILPSPKVFHQVYVDGALSPRLANQVRSFLHRMFTRERIDQAALDDGLAEVDRFAFHAEGAEPTPPRPVVGRTQALPFALPEFSLDAWGDDPSGASAEDAAQWYDGDGTDAPPARPE